MSTAGQRALDVAASISSLDGGGAPPLPLHRGLRTLVASSLAGEYVPPSVDGLRLAARLAAAMESAGRGVCFDGAGAGDTEGGGARGSDGSGDVVSLPIAGASHDLSQGAGAADAFVTAVGALLAAAVAVD